MMLSVNFIFLSNRFTYVVTGILMVALFSPLILIGQSESKKKSVRMGAYYFDGWSGLTQNHITQPLIDSFPEREPKWGWITSTEEIMKLQIDEAADAGLSFFSFCWYFPKNEKEYKSLPLNRALNFYLNAPNRQRLKFNLLIANHEGFLIGPENWDQVCALWVDLFKNPAYLAVEEKPLLIFFSKNTLIKKFGSEKAVDSAFNVLRTLSRKSGLSGVTIAACTSSDEASVLSSKACGFDLLTGYNYHQAGFRGDSKIIPVDSLIAGSERIWDKYKNTGMQYIPVVTINWDARPWVVVNKNLKNSPRYEGFSANSIYKTIRSATNWILSNPDNTTKEKICLVYAWNEYGEGAWLTPSRPKYNNMLMGVKKALR